jgi:hypothetical protein
MRITLDIDESQLEEIQQATGQQKKSPAIRQALDEFVTDRKRKQFLLKVMEGGVDYGLTNDELEARGTHDAD